MTPWFSEAARPEIYSRGTWRDPANEWSSSSGAELVKGSGNYMAPMTLEVQLNDGGTRRPTGDKVFVDVGSRAAMPSIPAPLARYDKYWREV